MKAHVKYEVVEKGGGLLRKGSNYRQVTISVDLTTEESTAMMRGGLNQVAVCDLPPQQHLFDFAPKEAAEQQSIQSQLTILLLGGDGHAQTFNRLIDARNFETEVLNGLKRIKDAIDRNIEIPFQAERTVEI